MNSSRLAFASVLLIWIALFFGQSWNLSFGIDGFTYAALAKNSVSTGQWTTLHLSDDLWPKFYQHPPLVIWLQSIFFYLFGVHELTTRLLMSLFSGGTLIYLWKWGKWMGSPWIGWTAIFTLMTSLQYVIYATDLYLDGPLTFFLVAGAASFLQLERKGRIRDLLVFSFAMTGAWMTKGLAGLALPVACGVYLCTFCFLDTSRAYLLIQRFLAGCGLTMILILIWTFYADGIGFFSNYWSHNVRGRLSSAQWQEHFLPLLTLLKTYWPGWPVLAYGLFRWQGKELIKSLHSPVGFAGINAAVIFLGLSWIGNFNNQYLVPFYAFSALLVAQIAFRWVRPRVQTLVPICFAAAVLLHVLLATLPFNLRSSSVDSVTALLREAQHRCKVHSPATILLSPSNDLEHTIPRILWLTSWYPRKLSTYISPVKSGDTTSPLLLLKKEADPIDDRWRKIPLQPHGDYTLWSSKESGTDLCD